MKRLLLASFVVALAVPAQASAARFAIGIQKGADEQSVARRVRAVTGQPVTKIGAFAVSVRARHAGELASVKGMSWVERMRPTRRLSFTPNDPLVNRQWYLGRIHAFDAWPQLPTLGTVRVAVLDSGVDSAHPDLQSQIVDGRSFVSSSWETDTNGHGTFVAGEIAAATNNGIGIAAVGFPAELLIAKIVRSDGTISPDAEARAIRWAVDRGARVINMSFGGVRDPRRADPALELRGLSRGPPARPRRELAEPRRNGADLLEPRPPVRGCRRSRRGDLFHAAARAHSVVQAQLRSSGVLGLRPDGVPPR
ncbi:MAG: hypothetical protein E6G31_03155 [Actinobacteria bacterium]|nr:MAG: hypothetical protein E6G31_03155 [Actinomycetota bacterium]